MNKDRVIKIVLDSFGIPFALAHVLPDQINITVAIKDNRLSPCFEKRKLTKAKKWRTYPNINNLPLLIKDKDGVFHFEKLKGN